MHCLVASLIPFNNRVYNANSCHADTMTHNLEQLCHVPCASHVLLSGEIWPVIKRGLYTFNVSSSETTENKFDVYYLIKHDNTKQVHLDSHSLEVQTFQIFVLSCELKCNHHNAFCRCNGRAAVHKL